MSVFSPMTDSLPARHRGSASSRKLLAGLAVAVLSALAVPARAEFLLQENDMLAICGDSITNMKEYPAYIEDYLIMCQPVPGIRVAQFGISGEKAAGLLARMDHAVLPFRPTVVSICYGMNDGGNKEPDAAVAEEYRSKLGEVVDRFKASGVRGGVIASPGAVDRVFVKNPEIDYNATLEGLRVVAGEVAAAKKLAFADLHRLMIDTMQSSKASLGHDYVFAGRDGVHPGPPGQLAMAYGILKAMGCDGAVGSFSVDLGTGKAEASAGHRIIDHAGGKLEIESNRYPFCFTAPGAKPDARKGLEPILPHLPFNRDLNRFVLVVKNLKEERAKISWGGRSRDFSRKDLENGINLAAEFLENPFCEPFFTIHEAVRERQRVEGGEMRNILHPLMKAPDAGEVARIQKETVAISRERADAVRAMVKPVRHVITIEPLSAGDQVR
jgi:lysophospholipase L1-like esterase